LERERVSRHHRELADFNPRIVRVDSHNRAYLGPTAM
jgi:hypothetical protein